MIHYEANLRVRCQKLHTCIACGTRFSYPLERSIQVRAINRQKAIEAGRRQLLRPRNVLSTAIRARSAGRCSPRCWPSASAGQR